MRRSIIPITADPADYVAATHRFIERLYERYDTRVAVVERLEEFAIVVVDSDEDVGIGTESMLAPFSPFTPGKTIGLTTSTAPVADEKGEALPRHITDIRADRAWQRGVFGQDVKVAVLDTGITPQPGLEVHGGISFIADSDGYLDDHGHGTECASIIGAWRSPDLGVAGVAPGVKLYAVKVLNATNDGTTVETLKGMLWAYRNRMDVVSMSLAEDRETCALPFYTRAVEVLRSVDCVVVAGAGNVVRALGQTRGTVRAPANSPGVVAVGAITEDKDMAEGSSRGAMQGCRERTGAVTVVAPGVGIMALRRNGGSIPTSGTSVACAQVAGLAALLKCRHPGLSANEIMARITATSVVLGDAGKSSVYGYGLIDCDAATQ